MPPEHHRILLIDDDSNFGKILKQEAKSKNISLIICLSLNNPELLAGQKFDCAIVDYDLGDRTTGPELGQNLVKVLGAIPMLLISQKPRTQADGNQWPACIKGFVHKESGHQAIINAALDVCRGVTPGSAAKG